MDTQGSLTHIAAIFKFGDVSGPRAKKWPKVNRWLIINQISVCLCVCLSTCLAVCMTTMYARRTNFRDDLDLDELAANDLPSDFLHKLCKFGGGMIKTDIVLHPYLLITQRGAFKMYIFQFKSWNISKNMVDSFPVIHELVRERRFPHFFRSQWPGKLGNPREFPVLAGYWLRKNCGNHRSRTNSCITGKKSVSPGVDAGI